VTVQELSHDKGEKERTRGNKQRNNNQGRRKKKKTTRSRTKEKKKQKTNYDYVEEREVAPVVKKREDPATRVKTLTR